VSGARQVALALREALGLDARLPHAALLRALRYASAQSHPVEWGEELCARVSIRDALVLAAAAIPKSAKAAARAHFARRRGRTCSKLCTNRMHCLHTLPSTSRSLLFPALWPRFKQQH